MKSPGELLKHARLEKGLSLSEAAAMTRISRTMLTHLEQDRFEEFNAEVFVRGHLRNYAREVGADAEKVIHAYDRLRNGPATAERQSVKTVERKPRAPKKPRTPKKQKAEAPRDAKPTSRARSPRKWAEGISPTHMVAILLVLVGLVLFVSLLSGNRATAQDPAQFPTRSQDAWELERDVEQTRWLLEQPASEKSDSQ